ncbi:hypothetical protein PFISCL1PPCAC_26070, partial [Pristionchus fissidentatus]
MVGGRGGRDQSSRRRSHSNSPLFSSLVALDGGGAGGLGCLLGGTSSDVLLLLLHDGLGEGGNGLALEKSVDGALNLKSLVAGGESSDDISVGEVELHGEPVQLIAQSLLDIGVGVDEVSSLLTELLDLLDECLLDKVGVSAGGGGKSTRSGHTEHFT